MILEWFFLIVFSLILMGLPLSLLWLLWKDEREMKKMVG